MAIEFRTDYGDILHIVVNKLEGGNVEIYGYNRSIPPNQSEDYSGGTVEDVNFLLDLYLTKVGVR